MEIGKTTLNSSEQCKMTRRTLLERLGLVATAAGLSRPLGAQGTPLKAVWINHYVYQTPDPEKTRDWYHSVFGMQIDHQNGNQSHMWFGDKGGDTCMMIRPSPPGDNSTKITSIAFTLENWDKKAVEAELKRRGLDPKADTDKCFRFKDMEGFDIAVCARNYLKRPSGSNEKPQLWKTLSANHIVETSKDYGKLRDWYKDLFHLRISHDSGRDVYMWVGDSVWIPTALRGDTRTSAELGSLDHVAYTIANYNKDQVQADCERLNMKPRVDTDLSFNCVDINGFKTQVCDKQLVPMAEKLPPGRGRAGRSESEKKQ